MENELNQTYIVLEGFAEMSENRYLYFAIMFTAYVLILCSNSSIVSLIWIHKNLHEPMYIFIAALLMNSVFYSTMIYPKLLTDVLSQEQVIPYSACLFQWFAYYCLGASEIFLLAVMAYDRYVSICKPLQYPTIMRKTKVCVLLLLAWLLPACLMAVPTALNTRKRLCRFTLKDIVCTSMVYKLHCTASSVLNMYGLVVFVSAALFFLLFILFTYIRIFAAVFRRSQKVRNKAAQTCLPHLVVLINTSCVSAFQVLILRVEADFPTTVHFVMTLQNILYHPLFNPIIYGLKMQEIYKHFIKWFYLTRKIQCRNTFTCITVIVFCHKKV